MKRNEALDLSVYALALAIVLGAEKIAWDRPLPWATAGPGNAFAIAAPTPEGEADGGEGGPGAGEAPPVPAVEPLASGPRPPGRPAKLKRRIGRRPDFSGW